MRIFITLLLLWSMVSQSLLAQTRIMIQPTEVVSSRKTRIISTDQSTLEASKVVPAHVTNFFATNKKFQVVDRKNITYIQDERELQKSEDFIDGYMVEQGMIEGADNIFRISYIEDEQVLSFQIYDVATGVMICSKDQSIKISYFGIRQLDRTLRNMLYEVLSDCFHIKYSFVRPIDEKNKSVQSALVAIGKSSQAKVEDRVEFYQQVTESIDGEEYVRRNVIATGLITQVQDDNFSVVKIIKGHTELFNQKGGSSKIYSIIKNEVP